MKGSGLYPEGEVVHRNLSADYTDVARLLSALRAEGFSGVVAIEAGERAGAFYLSSGEVIDAAVGEETHPSASMGEEAAEELLALAENPGALINVVRLSAKDVEFAAARPRAEVLFARLSTDYVRMDRLVQSLAADRLTGFVEISSGDNEHLGVLFLLDGEAAGMQMVSLDGASSAYHEGKMVPALIQEVMRRGALLTVYRSVPAENGATAPPWRDGAVAARIDARLPAGKEGPAATRRIVSLVDRQKEGDGGQDVRTDFVDGLEKVFGRIERFTDGLALRGCFERAFRRACVEKSELYPFLDPFEGLFDYDGAQIRIDTEVGTEEFAVGIAECLNLSLSYLRRELPGSAVLPPGLKAEIDASFSRYEDAIRRIGLQSVVPATMR